MNYPLLIAYETVVNISTSVSFRRFRIFYYLLISIRYMKSFVDGKNLAMKETHQYSFTVLTQLQAYATNLQLILIKGQHNNISVKDFNKVNKVIVGTSAVKPRSEGWQQVGGGGGMVEQLMQIMVIDCPCWKQLRRCGVSSNGFDK